AYSGAHANVDRALGQVPACRLWTMWTISDACRVDDVDGLPALIQRILDERDWTLGQLARRSGLSKSTLSAWKTGTRAQGSRGPDPASLRKLAAGAGVSVREVFEAAGRRVPGALSETDER